MEEHFSEDASDMELTPAIDTLARAVENLNTAEAFVMKARVATGD